jgi:hypothetical protein
MPCTHTSQEISWSDTICSSFRCSDRDPRAVIRRQSRRVRWLGVLRSGQSLLLTRCSRSLVAQKVASCLGYSGLWCSLIWQSSP